jgi:hypothetical protein
MKSFITTFLVFSGGITANSQTTLYTGDGTLTSNRIVTQSGKTLHLNLQQVTCLLMAQPD